jgi:hypothetical protein
MNNGRIETPSVKNGNPPTGSLRLLNIHMFGKLRPKLISGKVRHTAIALQCIEGHDL